MTNLQFSPLFKTISGQANPNRVLVSFSVRPGLPLILLASSVILLLISIFILSDRIINAPTANHRQQTAPSPTPITLHVAGTVKSIDSENQKAVIVLFASTVEYTARFTKETKFRNGSRQEAAFADLKVGDIVDAETPKVNSTENTFTAEKTTIVSQFPPPTVKVQTGGGN